MKKKFLLICTLSFVTNTHPLVCSETLSENEKIELAKKIRSNMGWFPFLSYGKPDVETIKASLSTRDGATLLENAIRSRLDFLMCGITYKGWRNDNLNLSPKEIILGYEMSLHTLSRHFQEFIAIFVISSTLLYKYVPSVKNTVHRLCNIE